MILCLISLTILIQFNTLTIILGLISMIFGFVAVTLAAVNIFGGFLVTQRMLAMYKKKPKTDKEDKNETEEGKSSTKNGHFLQGLTELK